MSSFLAQNTLALAVGGGAGAATYAFMPEQGWMMSALAAYSGFLGVHLPCIQQPSSTSYKIIRTTSWLAGLGIPFLFFFYRLTDLLVSLLAVYLLIIGLWWIIDRISLVRDFTQSLPAIVGLPVTVTGYAYLLTGPDMILPVFLACSLGYVIQLLVENHAEEVRRTNFTMIE
ncbi:MAG: hypothetical protein KDI15_05070 [Thiothrix sp.]|nr:hypothetical protein [Thiothrix sp.]HPE59679.1 hypothetical protein [Thiolinea sp.]